VDAPAGANGKYFQSGQESKSSVESMDEQKQRTVWTLSGGYTHLEGFEPLTATPPEPVVVNGVAADKDTPDGETAGARYTGSIARSAKRRYLSYSEADFEAFAQQGRHVAAMGGEIWHGGLNAKFHPHRCNNKWIRV